VEAQFADYRSLHRSLEVPQATSKARCWGRWPAKPCTLLTMSTGLSQAAKCIRENRIQYARQHGLESCEFGPTEPPIAKADLNFNWQKIVAVQHLLRSKRRAVFWIDGDALLLNYSVSVLHLMAQHAHKSFIFGSDYNRCDRNGPNPQDKQYRISSWRHCARGWSRRISGGIFIVRNSLRARQRLDYLFTRGGAAAGAWGQMARGGSSDNVIFNNCARCLCESNRDAAVAHALSRCVFAWPTSPRVPRHVMPMPCPCHAHVMPMSCPCTVRLVLGCRREVPGGHVARL
jgi:hypothetical protein